MTCWQRFPNPHELIEIKPIAQTKYDLELELEDEEDDTELERILSVRQENKELRYCKVQIEERDKIIEITEEKKTVMGDLNETQKRQLQLLLQKYQDVIAKEGSSEGQTFINTEFIRKMDRQLVKEPIVPHLHLIRSLKKKLTKD